MRVRPTRSRLRTLATCLVASVALSATSCGGATGVTANAMSLVEFLLVDESLQPAAPTGTLNLPRNTRLLMVFSELVNPESVTSQTVQVRHGPSFTTIPTGSFRVAGNQVIFDPTISDNGQPRPFGFSPVSQHSVTIPGFESFGDAAVENLDRDPNLTTFRTTFTTGAGFLRELVAPTVERVYFLPDVDDLTGNVPGNGVMAIEFNEAMDPSSFFLGAPSGPTPQTTVDVRFTNAPANVVATVDGKNVPGRLTHSDDARTYFFRPTFSFGESKLIFTVNVFQDCTDLAGNLLVNPRSFGPYTGDGEGSQFGKTIEEHFDFALDRDGPATTADWGSTEQGLLKGAPITSRQAWIYTYNFTDNGANSGRGEYAAFAAPLIGNAINQVNFNVTPPSSQGRRTQCTFSDTEMGPAGTVTGAAWGPDSNVTRAATYPRIVLRCGHQVDSSMNLGPSFSANFGGAATVLYDGDYDVLQSSDVGNTPGQPLTPHVGPYPVAGPGTVCWPAGGPPNDMYNQPLFDFTGWYEWPEFTSFFDWDPGDPLVEGDSVFLFDASVSEGDTWQDMRGWLAVEIPCSTTALVGQPTRNSLTVFEDDTALPGYPVTTIVDACFTITRKVSVAQSLFYSPPGFLFPASGGDTYGPQTDYLPVQIAPVVQPGGASIVLEFQGAMAVQDDRRTINQAQPFTPWTQNIDDCDGMSHIRWRATLTANLISGELPRLDSVVIPMLETMP